MKVASGATSRAGGRWTCKRNVYAWLGIGFDESRDGMGSRDFVRGEGKKDQMRSCFMS